MNSVFNSPYAAAGVFPNVTFAGNILSSANMRFDEPSAIPEPGSLLLVLAGGLLIAIGRARGELSPGRLRRRRRRVHVPAI